MPRSSTPFRRGPPTSPAARKRKDARILFSLDGKDFKEPQLLKHKARLADGTESEFPAPPEMYTHIQWNLLKAVPPGGTGSMSFKVRVK